MVDNVFFKIEKALQTILDSIPGHPKIQWENDSEFTPQLGVKYWKTSNISLTDSIISAGRLHRHTGIFQVSVVVPKAATNRVLINDMDLIRSAYNLDAIYEDDIRVDILSTPRGPVIPDNIWTTGVMQIYYECITH